MDPLQGAIVDQEVLRVDTVTVNLLNNGLYAIVIRRNGTIIHCGPSTALRLRVGDVDTRYRTQVTDQLPQEQLNGNERRVSTPLD
jgi:hypothetical protein